MKRIGVVGLGNMGQFMVKNLLKKGYEVTVFDVRKEAIDAAAANGAKPASSLKDLGSKSDVVFVMVLNAAQVRSVTMGPDGLIEGMKKGGTVIVTSTIAQAETAAVAQYGAERGINFIDSPVSGGVIGAEKGTLVMMAACPDAVFEDCKDVLLTVGSNTYHVGKEAGMGQTVKAAVQLLVSIHVAATGEAMVMSQKAGVDPEMLTEIVSKSVGTSYQFELKAPAIMQRDFTTKGALDIQIKDLDICLKMGRDLGVPLYLSSICRELYITAESMGYGREDLCAVAKVYENVAKCVVEKKK